ncbi:FkbM family methyltransferase [Phyllobacterium chamaecytisi]|uniref:FkbM family methyltransferase n=1 Tax=Phyllobacterium chamaecytisi TaxID=2876082 RepID=UPI001CCC3FC8|nr:FkbM family methyltransferase [Phyllobacterium sp. KW56]MBZ9603163.1 FkbM family methyltransferase [Phyllobacterium sp. KW56]
MEVLTVHGIRVPLTCDEVSPAIWQALTSGSYEAKEARSVFKAVRPNDRVLELGTGIGIITSLIAKIPGVQVWSFEANPSTAALAHRVISANDLGNVVLSQGILIAGEPCILPFYVREDLWMSSLDKRQGSYQREISLTSTNIDDFIADHAINVLVMDIEGAERDLLGRSALPHIERIFLELHDHLYGLSGIREITQALAMKGFAYDPRGSNGPCVLFAKDEGLREFEPEVFEATD